MTHCPDCGRELIVIKCKKICPQCVIVVENCNGDYQ